MTSISQFQLVTYVYRVLNKYVYLILLAKHPPCNLVLLKKRKISEHDKHLNWRRKILTASTHNDTDELQVFFTLKNFTVWIKYMM